MTNLVLKVKRRRWRKRSDQTEPPPEDRERDGGELSASSSALRGETSGPGGVLEKEDEEETKEQGCACKFEYSGEILGVVEFSFEFTG